MTHTITTHWHKHSRVSFSHPEGSFGLEDLELLEAAIKHARRRLAEIPSSAQADAPTQQQPTLQQAYAEQVQRQAAPT